MKERRQYKRTETESSVHIHSKYFLWYKSSIVNISELGLSIKSPAAMPAGHRVNLCITLPNTAEKSRIFSTATVMHCHKHKEQYIIGLRFDILDRLDQEAIRTYVDAGTDTRLDVKVA